MHAFLNTDCLDFIECVFIFFRTLRLVSSCKGHLKGLESKIHHYLVRINTLVNIGSGFSSFLFQECV